MRNKPKGTHLTFAERAMIEAYLKEGRSFSFIARELNCSVSTISREVQNRKIEKIPISCDCINLKECRKRHVCGAEGCNKRCCECSLAKKKCPDYSRQYCDELLRSRTGTCNACKHRGICNFTTSRYDAEKAQYDANALLVESRSGRNITDTHIEKINDIVTPLIKQGQSVYHIVQTHAHELGISESTLRRMVNDCDIDARNLDLRCTVQRKVRKSRNTNYKIMNSVKDGHKYEDYLVYMEENDVSAVQMDCVEGTKNDNAVLLTLHFPVCHIQLALILNEQTTVDVVAALDKLEEILGSVLFSQCFPVILTDNGHEFADIEGIERSIAGGKRTKVFYCEPRRSDEKGACENNHKYIRYVLPKGTSLDHIILQTYRKGFFIAFSVTSPVFGLVCRPQNCLF